MIKGLADVVKSSHDAQKSQQEEIRALADSMKDLATSTAKTTSAPSGLRLPPVNLPVFKGDPQDKFERFLENFVSIISTSNISPRYYVLYLKQQCQFDIRSFEIITHAEKEHLPKLIADPRKPHLKNLRLISTLLNKFYCNGEESQKNSKSGNSSQSITEWFKDHKSL